MGSREGYEPKKARRRGKSDRLCNRNEYRQIRGKDQRRKRLV